MWAMRSYDVTVIGSGPAGMAAAVSASDEGASVCLVEREEQMGGILKQCIHDGFGLIRFNEKLTGPEYAWRYKQMVAERPVDFLSLSFLTSVVREDGGFVLSFVNPVQGVFQLKSKALVMAMGCRERTGRQIFLHGDRPAGIFTAGQAQDFINLKGYMPGRRCVILGSGDIGLIMARRLTLEGAEVEGVYEIGSRPSGLTRNIAQCLDDYDIPLHLEMTVTEVHGRHRLEAVTVSRVNSKKQPVAGTERLIKCDSLILSVGLIPENDILSPLEVALDSATKGPVADQNMQTSVAGIFSCGNALHVSDLVDYVSESGHTAGRSAARFCDAVTRSVSIKRSGALQYTVPQRLDTSRPGKQKIPFFFRPSDAVDKAVLKLSCGNEVLFSRSFSWLKPSEMQRVEIELEPSTVGGDIRFSLEPVVRSSEVDDD